MIGASSGYQWLILLGQAAVAVGLLYLLRPHVWPELSRLESKEREEAWLKATRSQVVRWPTVGFVVAAITLVWLIEGALLEVAFHVGNLELSRYREYSVSLSTFVILFVGVPLFCRRRIAMDLRRQLIEKGEPICLQCGYDLTGNLTGSCSECGAAIET